MSQLSNFSSALLVALLTFIPLHANAQAAPSRTPVLVELFTSEGCSTCPPADALLASLDRDQPIATADIIILGEHVDYWDQQGWHDRFSSPRYTERQRQYRFRFNTDDVYTPQMIVNGSDQFVGNDAAHARQAILRAAQLPTLHLTLSQPAIDNRRISATVSSPATPSQQADLFAALVEPTATTDVRRGENGGRVLPHAGVVRSLQRIGSTSDLATPKPFILNVPNDAVPATLRIVIFAQAKGQGAILGAAAANVTP